MDLHILRHSWSMAQPLKWHIKIKPYKEKAKGLQGSFRTLFGWASKPGHTSTPPSTHPGCQANSSRISFHNLHVLLVCSDFRVTREKETLVLTKMLIWLQNKANKNQEICSCSENKSNIVSQQQVPCREVRSNTAFFPLATSFVS
jgi:hypothetical protein